MLALVQVHLFKLHRNVQQSKIVYLDYPDLSTIRGRYQSRGCHTDKCSVSPRPFGHLLGSFFFLSLLLNKVTDHLPIWVNIWRDRLFIVLELLSPRLSA